MSAPLAHGGLGTYTVTAADVENARQIEEQLHGRDPGGGRRGKCTAGKARLVAPSLVFEATHHQSLNPKGGV
jgi:hypothetical protein